MIFLKKEIEHLTDKFIHVTEGESTQFGRIKHIVFKLDNLYYRFSTEVSDIFIDDIFSELPDEVECQEVEPYQVTTTHFRIKR